MSIYAKLIRKVDIWKNKKSIIWIIYIQLKSKKWSTIMTWRWASRMTLIKMLRKRSLTYSSWWILRNPTKCACRLLLGRIKMNCFWVSSGLLIKWQQDFPSTSMPSNLILTGWSKGSIFTTVIWLISNYQPFCKVFLIRVKIWRHLHTQMVSSIACQLMCLNNSSKLWTTFTLRVYKRAIVIQY